MQRTKIICPLCGQEISKSNYSKHQRRHENHPETFKKSVGKYKLTHDGLTCQYCGKEYKNRNSLCNHERQCKDNADRQVIIRNGFNNIGRVAWNKGLTKEIDERVLKQSNSLINSYATGKSAKPGGFKKYSAQKCKYGTYKGFYCDSSWELAVLMYCLDNNIDIKRNSQAFVYIFNGKEHKYYPDFIIDGVYVEVKGRLTEQDKAKIEQFPFKDNFYVINSSNIKVYINYASNVYGKDFDKCYDRNFPCWLDKLGVEDKKYNFKTTR